MLINVSGVPTHTYNIFTGIGVSIGGLTSVNTILGRFEVSREKDLGSNTSIRAIAQGAV